MWFSFAILSGLFYTGSQLISRHVLKGGKDSWAFSFYFSFVGAIVSFPFMLMDLKLPHSIGLYAVMLFTGFFIVGHNYLIFKAQNYLEPSLQGAILKFRLVWVFALGVILLSESITAYKVIGTILAFLAGVVVVGKFGKRNYLKGITLVIFSTILYSSLIILNKYLLEDFNAASLTFFIFFFPTIINYIVMPQRQSRITSLSKSDFKFVILSCIFGAFANLAMNEALDLGEASKVLVIIESFLIVILAGEKIFLKEKGSFLTKLIAVGLATAGGILIRIS